MLWDWWLLLRPEARVWKKTPTLMVLHRKHNWISCCDCQGATQSPLQPAGWDGITCTHFQPQASKQPLISHKGPSSSPTPCQVLGFAGSSMQVPFSQCLPRKPRGHSQVYESS